MADSARQVGPLLLQLTAANNYRAVATPFSCGRRGSIRLTLVWHTTTADSTNVLHRAVLLNPKGREVARIERLLNNRPVSSHLIYEIIPTDVDQARAGKTHWLVQILSIDPSLNRRPADVSVEIRYPGGSLQQGPLPGH
jgi:hypothetical protein